MLTTRSLLERSAPYAKPARSSIIDPAGAHRDHAPMRRLHPRILRVLLLSGLASFAVYGGASCDPKESTQGTGGGGGGGELGDVIYEGTNDEALEALLAVMPVKSPPKRPLFDFPVEGAELPSSPIPTFSWHVAATGDAGDAGARAPVR